MTPFKIIAAGAALLLTCRLLYAQSPLPERPAPVFSTYYHQRASLFSSLPRAGGTILFIGNSITDGGEWSELFHDIKVKNRGISGDVTEGVLNRLKTITGAKPAKVFLLIGINDLGKAVPAGQVVASIFRIVDSLHHASPATRVYVQSLLPVNPAFKKFPGHTDKTAQINDVNSQLFRAAKKQGYTYIPLHDHFADTKGFLKARYTNDGLHLTGEGYTLWEHIVFPFVYDLEPRPSLIPLPKQLWWHKGFFRFDEQTAILVPQKGLEREAHALADMIRERGYEAQRATSVPPGKNCVELRLEPSGVFENAEAYELAVTEHRILIRAKEAHGIFNGIQTLRQLWRSGRLVDQCTVKDAPAFSWRGYMIDVGRNYMSPDLLKQQIDVMSRYKLNVFHFHATEDIAWRIAIDQYPRLTSPGNMERNKGLYYSKKEIRELIDYCRERYITFVPEIDMPGHSAAFKRAFKTDMQSDSGIVYVKNILREFCDAYDVPYIHIGADEVKITNPAFIPEMTRYLESRGKKVIGWQPGGNFTGSTLQQLWKGGPVPPLRQEQPGYIDSRHLYLNHMDPLEAVVTLFNRHIGTVGAGSAAFLGATLCVWHDRAVREEADVLKMNPVYPGMLAFSERIWRGGGQPGWVANISDGDAVSFAAFERRLLDHKKTCFKDKPFPYTKQADLLWKLTGPFKNNGQPAERFFPETAAAESRSSKTARGGTIVLRHWWYPLIKGAVDHPKDSTTWYASTAVWSDTDGEKAFWIGFNNLSRSMATDSPPEGAWDNRGSQLWVNDRLIAPPSWNRPAQKGDPEIPLTDEGYEYRAPAFIFLKKGWNKVLVKLPVTSFTAGDWQNPVKWMFTFVPLNGYDVPEK